MTATIPYFFLSFAILKRRNSTIKSAIILAVPSNDGSVKNDKNAEKTPEKIFSPTFFLPLRR